MIKHATLLFLYFYYAPKRPSPFFLYIPTKNPLSTIKYELSNSCHQTGQKVSKRVKKWPSQSHELRYAPPQKIPLINVIQLFMGVNEMCVKILPLLTYVTRRDTLIYNIYCRRISRMEQSA